MIHEGPLTWKVSKDKQIGQYLWLNTFCIDTYSLIGLVSYPLITRLCVPSSEIQALLLSDCLVLLQRGPDDRLQLRYPSRWLGGGGGGSGDSKTSFSPLVKLDSLLVRSVATGKTVVTPKESWFSPPCFVVLIKCVNVAISLQTTKPSTSSAPQRGRSTSWWPGHRQRKTRKFFSITGLCLRKAYQASVFFFYSLQKCMTFEFCFAAGKIYLKRPSHRRAVHHPWSITDPCVYRE